MEDIKRKFVELFYPQELIRIANKFRQEGTLNKETLWQLDKNIYISFFGGFFFFILFWLKIGFLLSAILFFLLVKMIKREIKQNFDKNIVPYVNGMKVKVKVVQSGIYGVYLCHNILRVSYESIDSPGTTFDCEAVMKASYLLRRDILPKEENIPQKDQICFVYQSNLDKTKVMPDIKFFKETYSLTTSII